MKNWIKQILRESLNEMTPINKPEFGSGMDHTVFKSKQHPDRLYKIGRENNIKVWVPIFKAYPKIFPRVYRVFPLTKDPYFWVAEIEKLNTDTAKKDFKLASDYLEDYTEQIFKFPIRLARIDIFDNESNIPFSVFIIKFKNWLLDIHKDERIIKNILMWVKTVYQIYKLLDKKYQYEIYDIHSGNVAYDNNGNIKIIDI
jgi:hypothetical protein